jgi:hypothetical protein
MQAVALSGKLEEWLGRRLSPTLIYNYPTIAALANHLAGEARRPSGAHRPPRQHQNNGDVQAKVLNEIAGLSDEEMAALLVQEMTRSCPNPRNGSNS